MVHGLNHYPIFKNCDELLQDNRVSDIWKDFINYQSSSLFFEQFVKIFKDDIKEY